MHKNRYILFSLNNFNFVKLTTFILIIFTNLFIVLCIRGFIIKMRFISVFSYFEFIHKLNVCKRTKRQSPKDFIV